MTAPEGPQSPPDAPSEPDWRAYASRLEQRLAAALIDAERLLATIETLNGYVLELEANQEGGTDATP